MSLAVAGFARGSRTRPRLVLGLTLLGMLLVVLVALQARDAVRRAWARSWVSEAEELGSFARAALAVRSDLLLVERLTRLARRDDVAYALILDPDGRARFHGNAPDVGRKYDSAPARRALAARETYVQSIRSHGVLEVDVPLERGVLRMGFTFAPLDSFFRWLWGGVLLSCALLGVAGLALARSG